MHQTSFKSGVPVELSIGRTAKLDPIKLSIFVPVSPFALLVLSSFLNPPGQPLDGRVKGGSNEFPIPSGRIVTIMRSLSPRIFVFRVRDISRASKELGGDTSTRAFIYRKQRKDPITGRERRKGYTHLV